MFSTLQEEFAKRDPLMRFVDHSRFGNIHGADEQQVIKRLPRLSGGRVLDRHVLYLGEWELTP